MRHWTLEERRKQSELISQWKPWAQSTGPKTVEGQLISKMNAYKHGTRCVEIRKMIKDFAVLKKEFNRVSIYLKETL